MKLSNRAQFRLILCHLFFPHLDHDVKAIIIEMVFENFVYVIMTVRFTLQNSEVRMFLFREIRDWF